MPVTRRTYTTNSTDMIIYISMPISGYDLAERRRLAEKARHSLLSECPEAEVVTPFDIGARVEKMNPAVSYSDYMKEDIAFIIDFADAVCFLVNPLTTKSKGVRLEYWAARVYGKRIERRRVTLTRPWVKD